MKYKNLHVISFKKSLYSMFFMLLSGSIYCQNIGKVFILSDLSISIIEGSEVDSIDIDACRSIKNNIQSIGDNVDWMCDFPISANNFELGKPAWIRVFNDERENALNTVRPKGSTDDGSHPIYRIKEKINGTYIYGGGYAGFSCDGTRNKGRTNFWLMQDIQIKKSHLWVNYDLIEFYSRIYAVKYHENDSEKSFLVSFVGKKSSTKSEIQPKIDYCKIK